MNDEDKEFEEFYKSFKVKAVSPVGNLYELPKDVVKHLFKVLRKEFGPIPPEKEGCSHCKELYQNLFTDFGLPDLANIISKFLDDGVSFKEFIFTSLIKEIRLLKEVIKKWQKS